MFRGRGGGFASYTKTGRSIAMGRACGQAWARQSNKSDTSNGKNEPPTYIWIMMIVVWFILFNKMSKGSNQQSQ
jgi:hypothetical protein